MRDTVLRVAYVGNNATYQDSYDDWNQPMPNYVWMVTQKTTYPTGTAANTATRPISAGPYGNLQEWRKDGWGWANGITAELQRRYSKGVGFQIMYQFFNSTHAASHGWYYDSSISPVSSFLPAEQIPDRNKYMKTYMYKRDTNIPHDELRWNWIVDVPVGRGKKFLGHANKFLDAFVGGWQLTSMGRWRNNWISLPTGSNWPTGNPVQYYGRDIPIQDCTSGVCRNSYLMWNGYIPAYLINSVDATGKPNGYMGIPADYKPAVAPLWPYPADYRSRTAATDPNFSNYGTSYIWLPVTNQAAPVRVNLQRHRQRPNRTRLSTRLTAWPSSAPAIGTSTPRSSSRSPSRSGPSCACSATPSTRSTTRATSLPPEAAAWPATTAARTARVSCSCPCA